METQLPAGPRIPRVIQTFLYAQRYGRFLQAQGRRHRGVFTLRMMPPLPRRMVVFSSPEHIREIFSASASDLLGGNVALGPVLGAHSLPVAEADEHSRGRKLLAPAFSRSAVSDYRPLIEEVARSHVDGWDNSTQPILKLVEAMTLDIIMRVIFGVTDKQVANRIVAAVEPIIHAHPLVFAGWKPPGRRLFGPWKKLHKGRGELDRLLWREVQDRTTNPKHRQDVLSRLIERGAIDERNFMEYTELRDHLVTMLLAGHETTAAAVAWALHELAAAPDVQSRARDAAKIGDQRYLEAVVKEAMRRRPVAGEARRRLARDMTLCGLSLPAGTYVSTSIELAHSNPQNHRQPDAFDPDRFLNGEVSTDTWFPFGGGVRRCIGAHLALIEGTILLTEILTRMSLSLPEGAEYNSGTYRNITFVPQNDAPVRLEKLDV